MNVTTLASRLVGESLLVRNWYYRVLIRYYVLRNRLLREGYGRWDEILYVDPDAIRYITHADEALDYSHGYLDVGAFDIVERAGEIVGGDWDEESVRFEDLYVYQALERRYIEGVPWEETRYYDHFVEKIAGGKVVWGCTSEQDLRRRCAEIDSLVHTILEDGYRSQSDLGKLPVAEVTVNVGRDGSLLFNDGRHRLAIAKVLGIAEIPVRVVVVHEAFAREHGLDRPRSPSLASLVETATPSQADRWRVQGRSEPGSDYPQEDELQKESA